MKKEKKKGSCLKTVLIAFGVLVILGVIGSACGDDTKTDNKSITNNDNEEMNDSIESADDSSSATTPDSSVESVTDKKDPLGFNVVFNDTYRNDVTGNWRLARIAENINIEEHAVDYYNNYFKSDSEIHIIINFTLNTTTRITVMGNFLDVSIMEYVDKEEHDASLACSGTLLKEYHVDINTREIENIQ